jgi:hypothetical protein
MKKLFKISVLLGVMFLFACNKEESVIDKSILMNYNFQHSLLFVTEGNTVIQKDTIVYSFVDGDSVSATKYHYEPSESGVYELVAQDTYSRKYAIDGDFIHFILSSDIEVYDYLFSFHWKVKAMSKERLSVDLYTNNQCKGSANLICLKK